jgi:FkbH-like protein
MTTRRYTEDDIRRFCHSDAFLVLSVDASDRFGKSDGVGLAIVKRSDPQVWEIDTFLMSCRILGRGVEDAFLADLARRAKEGGVAEIRGEVVFTRKNLPARDFYAKCGFRKTSESEEGTCWIFNPQETEIEMPTWIETK